MENNPSLDNQPLSPVSAPASTPALPPMDNKWLWPTIIGGVVLVLIVGSGFYMFSKYQTKACTMEAKLCPDGSSVGRTGPNCEFAVCPTTTPDVTVDWKTYRNEQYGFELQFPENWVLKEQLANPGVYEIDISVHSPLHKDSYFRVLPNGWSAGDGPSSRSQITNENILGKNSEVISFLLEDGSVWGRWIRLINIEQRNWSNDGSFIMMFARVSNLEKKCLVAITPNHPECGFGDLIGYYGTVDTQDWKILTQILSTFKFINQTTIEYKNSEYGFSLTLPASWKGYTVEKESWGGSYLDRISDGPIEFGPQIIVKNPKGEKWQPVPIMVFTPAQWQLIVEEKLGVSGAPIGPSKLGQNSKYIFALPPRWVGFVDYYGQDEAVSIAETFKAY